MSTYLIKIFGRVQGVGFRYSAQREAEKHHLKGWVKNEPDGSVTVEATGEEFELDIFCDWCRRGPATAKVDKIQIEKEEKPSWSKEKFEVIY
jgi:acylphosphatase